LPCERFLIVRDCDHHPLATRTSLGFKDETEAEDVALDPDSIGFITSYAVQGINYAAPALPKVDRLDASYLGSLILELARRLPPSQSHPQASAADGPVPGPLLQLQPARGDPALPSAPDRFRHRRGTLRRDRADGRRLAASALQETAACVLRAGILAHSLPAWQSGNSIWPVEDPK
jgi:hypothetical protein